METLGVARNREHVQRQEVAAIEKLIGKEAAAEGVGPFDSLAPGSADLSGSKDGSEWRVNENEFEELDDCECCCFGGHDASWL